jgi:hypothetical protein
VARGEETEFTVEDLEGVGDLIDEKPDRKPDTKRKSTGSTGRKPPLKKRLETMIGLIGNVTAGFDQFDGGVIKDNAEAVADALVDLANESPRAKRVLEGLLEGGAWAGVGAVVGWEIVTPIAVHHRMLPEPFNTNLANVRRIPLKDRKVPKISPTGPRLVAVPVDLDDDSPDPSPSYVMARDPKTGQEAMFPADGNGRPIFPEPSDDDEIG